MVNLQKNNQNKIHYLILAHKDFNQVKLLVNRLKTENSEIYLHIDGKVKDFPIFKDVTMIKNRVSVNWWWFTQIKTEVTWIKQIYENMKEWDHLVIISWQCLPIQKIKKVEKYINDLGNVSCIPYIEADDWIKSRVTKYHYNDTDFKIWFINQILTKLINIIWINTKDIRIPIVNLIFDKITSIFLPKRKYLLKYKIYKWSNRIVLSYKHVKRAINFLKSDEGKLFYNSFKMSSCADELFFQTMLLNSPVNNEIKNKSLWYIRWENWHWPFVLTKNDYEKIKQSGKLFARKFDINEDWEIVRLLEKDN